MPPWDPWPDFQLPPEYATKRGSELLLSIIDLAQAVPPADPDSPDAQAARQRAQQLLAQPDSDFDLLLDRWCNVVRAYRSAQTSDWTCCRVELETTN